MSTTSRLAGGVVSQPTVPLTRLPRCPPLCGPVSFGHSDSYPRSILLSPSRMNLEKLKDTARKLEQKEDWRKAIEVYLKAIQQAESGAETTPDLSLYNRVGDLYLKINDTAEAVRSYERAVDLYADQGFFNNAIALCGKILRVNPGRTQTYLKLSQLHARKNVAIEAKRNLIEFLERMNALGQLDQAFQAVGGAGKTPRAFSNARPIRSASESSSLASTSSVEISGRLFSTRTRKPRTSCVSALPPSEEMSAGPAIHFNNFSIIVPCSSCTGLRPRLWRWWLSSRSSHSSRPCGPVRSPLPTGPCLAATGPATRSARKRTRRRTGRLRSGRWTDKSRWPVGT